ncbi:hypothetical protein OC834_006496 [Tilletia horrida]|nr:hypothetical protein OC834_006496 [Tilletia horrida]
MAASNEPAAASRTGAASNGGTAHITLDDRKSAMQRILRGMYAEAEFESGSRMSSPGPAVPINPSTSLPVIGAAWTEQVHVHTVPVAGISILRNSVRKELDFLNRAEAKQAASSHDSSADVTISSNAPFLESMWRCVQHYVQTAPPLTDLSAAVPSSSLPHRSRSSSSSTPPTKIDVVADGGNLWVRLFTLKPSSLLQEFRRVEAEEADASSDDGEEEDPDGRLGSASSLATALTSDHFAFDNAARACSLVQTALELRSAADRAYALQSSTLPGAQPIQIHLILTRLDWPAGLPRVAPGQAHRMRDFGEDARYRLRLHTILEELSRIPRMNIYTSDKIPFAQAPHRSPPTAPTFVPRDDASTSSILTRHLNLDLSALVALTSDIVHGDPIPPDASLDSSKAYFHTSAPYKPVRSSDPDTKPNVQSGAHGRALAEQLWRECCQGIADGGDFLHSLVHVPRGSAQLAEVVFWTTKESAEKFMEIVDLVAGEHEKRRAHALLGRDSDHERNERDFWLGSRWEGDSALRQSLKVPVRIIDRNSPKPSAWTDPLATNLSRDLIAVIQRSLRAQDEDVDFVGPSSSSGNGASADQDPSPADSPSSNGPGPTPHTLRSLLAGCQLGMTTLTTNFTSIKWLVRQWPSEQGVVASPPSSAESARLTNAWPTLPSSLGLIGKYYLNQDQLAATPSSQSAVVWVLHPRSFAEQMRVKPPGSLPQGTPIRSTQTSSFNAANGNNTRLISSYPILQPHTFRRGASTSDRVIEQSRRSRWRPSVPSAKAIGLWLQGPSKPEKLVIRHYPWWPLQGIERHWLRLTAPVAWKDPDHSATTERAQAEYFDGNAQINIGQHGPGPLAALEGLRDRGRAKARAGLRNVREGLPTWIRSAPKHHDAQIELSPSPERRRQPMEDSADTAVESSADEGLRRRHYVSGYEVRTPEALQPTVQRYESGSSLPRLAAPRSGRIGKRNGSTEGLSTDSDKTADTQDMLLPIAEIDHRPAANGRAAAHTERVDEEAPARDDFIASVRRDLRLNWLHWLLLFITCACWIIAFGVLAKSLWYESSVFSTSPGGGGEQSATFYGCTSTYWLRNAECGLNGQNCAPFVSDSPAAFRCPQGCLGTKLGAPRAVGDEVAAWVPLVVGGGDSNQTYRGDSWVCAAAAHAGVIDDRRGGCGTLSLTGTFSDFIGVRRNGVDSVSFNSTFPLSYRFGTNIAAGKCTDRRGQLYVLDVIMSAFVGFVLRPKPIVWYWILVCVGYWHVNFASEPRDYPPPVGAAFGDFLPTLFACYVVWRIAFRFVWPYFAHVPLERETLTLAAFWIGVLLNVVFADVPLNRLVGRDLASQPGSITALVIIIIVVIVLALNQVRVIRKTTLLPRYLSIYAVGAVVVGLLAAIPGESLRLHHYIIALVLLPGCAFPTRLSLIYCAFLLGMMENGLGRWGFDGIIQDVATVIGDGTLGTGRPVFLNSSTNWAGVNSSSPIANGIVAWAPLNTSDPDQQGFDSFNLLVDDVLRYSGSGTTFNLSTLIEDFDVGTGADDGTGAALVDQLQREPHFLRLAFASGSGSSPGDFTRAATVYFNGTFVDAPPGAT